MSLDTTEFQSRKENLRIVIFGSYSALSRLEALRDCLQAAGYNAKLVKDIEFPVKSSNETDEEFNVRKSLYWLENSGANFLVFLKDVNNEGVALELGALCSSYLSKLPLSKVFFEEGPKRYSSMIRGSVQGKKIYHYNFDTDEALCEFAKAAALNLFLGAS